MHPVQSIFWLAMLIQLLTSTLTVAAREGRSEGGSDQDEPAVGKKQMSYEDRPKLLVSQSWEGDVLSEHSKTTIHLVLFNIGSTEARRVTVTFPSQFGVDPIEIESVLPDAKEVRSIELRLKEPFSLSAAEAVARVGYFARGSSKGYVGRAMPSKAFRVLAVPDFERETSKHYFEWTLFAVLSYGAGVGVPLMRLYGRKMAGGKKIK
jgi:hypothetical protein